MCLVWGKHSMQTEFWWGKPREKYALRRLRKRWETDIRIDLFDISGVLLPQC
jgi:hypothetical protein